CTGRRHMPGVCPRMEQIAELASAVPDLIIEVPNRRRWFRLDESQLHPALVADLANWLSTEQAANPKLRRARLRGKGRRRRKPIRPTTAASYRTLILQFIAMEIQGGVPVEHLNSLADVVNLDNVDRGLAQYEAHFKGEKRRHLGQVMRIVCLIARHWVRVS